MPPIYVDTNHSRSNPIYDAARADKSAVAAENKMQKAVRKVVGKAAGFTTNEVKNPKGYAIRLELAKLVVGEHDTKCTLSGSLLRYPKTLAQKGQSKGDTMVSTSWSGSATATGTSEQALLDCVEAVAESMVEGSLKVMRADITQW